LLFTAAGQVIMTTWTPISEAGIWDKIVAAEGRMSVRQTRLWNAIRIEPERWAQTPWGKEGGGFWAVGVFGRLVIWFNDIEGGFNVSKYRIYREIEEYLCDQSELEDKLEKILHLIESGYELGPSLGPPRPGVIL
jgi:hypothetical protein